MVLETAQTFYVAAEHGIYSTKDKKFITGGDTTEHGGLKDGPLSTAEYEEHRPIYWALF